MIFKKDDVVWSIEDGHIIDHLVEAVECVTWIQLLKIHDEWIDSREFYSSYNKAHEDLERCVPRRMM